MEIYERIRELRKNHLHLSQTEFGKRLGVSRSVVNNIELNALAKPDQKMSLYKLICKEFHIREEWLLYGKDPMEDQTPSSMMEKLKEDYGLDDFAFGLVYEYLKLDPDKRDVVRNYIANVMNRVDAEKEPIDIPETPEEMEKKFPPVDMDEKKKSDAG